MIIPSSIVPESSKVQVKEVETGLFVVPNAYEGSFEYFPGKSIGEVDSAGNVEFSKALAAEFAQADKERLA